MQTTEQEILAADAARRAALLAADRATLDRLLTHDFRYVHASGKVEVRNDYLASAGSPPSKFLSMDVEDTLLKTYGDVVVMSGKVKLKRNDAGDALSKEHQFTAVWVKRSGDWALTSFQNSSKPKP